MSRSRIPLRRVGPERLRHETGELLHRRDFSDQAAQDDQLRWWHTRAVHGVWGIAEGLNVSGIEPGGTARISVGVAIDCFGRELILDRAQSPPVPETADEYLLVISYDRPPFSCTPPSGTCIDSFVAESGVRLSWLLRRSFSPTDGVTLAILNEDDSCPPQFARPHVRPQARPTIEHGVVTISSQDFVPWIEQLDSEPELLGWEFVVDTTAAGFTRTPFYFAELVVPVQDAPPDVIYAVGRHHLAEARRDRFSIRYFSTMRNQIGGNQGFYSSLSMLAARRFATIYIGGIGEGDLEIDVPIRISWIGIESHQRALRFVPPKFVLNSEVSDELRS